MKGGVTKKEMAREICRLAFLERADRGLMTMRKKDLQRLLTALQLVETAPAAAEARLTEVDSMTDLCVTCESYNDPRKKGWRFEDGLCRKWLLSRAKTRSYVYDPVVECEGFEKKREIGYGG